MAIARVLLAFVLTFALARADDELHHTARLLKGSVTCLDCPKPSDLSGIQVLVKCEKVKKLAMSYTEEDGSFTAELPSDGEVSSTNCAAKIMGGPHQLYTSAHNSVVAIASAKETFTTSRPLSYYKSCPSKERASCEGKDMGFASSKTVDLPLPREWGLAPSSYYVPFIPIIGIP
ncbi:hypothetical protein C2S52_004125 [Perilla frutescens var. hirtella]|nr:hypothetical protein C2S51_011428 [Perilla frutescens var. frutescens]KAH6793648.1 hypothetical protein C2S52_004125 [Perilla frutescens var. hirtella]